MQVLPKEQGELGLGRAPELLITAVELVTHSFLFVQLRWVPEWQGLGNPDTCFPLVDLKNLTTRTRRQTETPHMGSERVWAHTHLHSSVGEQLYFLFQGGGSGSMNAWMVTHVFTPFMCAHTVIT